MGEKVALDTPVFVYFLERDPRHGAACRRVMAAVERGSWEAVTSSLCVAEALVRPFALGNRGLALQIRAWFEGFPHLDVRPPTFEIVTLAAELHAAHGLRLADAVVGATALAAGCRRLVTNDRDLRVLEERGLAVEILGMSS